MHLEQELFFRIEPLDRLYDELGEHALGLLFLGTRSRIRSAVPSRVLPACLTARRRSSLPGFSPVAPRVRHYGAEPRPQCASTRIAADFAALPQVRDDLVRQILSWRVGQEPACKRADEREVQGFAFAPRRGIACRACGRQIEIVENHTLRMVPGRHACGGCKLDQPLGELLRRNIKANVDGTGDEAGEPLALAHASRAHVAWQYHRGSPDRTNAAHSDGWRNCRRVSRCAAASACALPCPRARPA